MVKKKILIIDDEKDLCRFVKKNLELTGIFEVDIATNGIDGIIKAQKVMPDLILLDVMMPVMDGIETLKRLRKDKDIFKIPVIMLTAVGYGPFKSRALELYADSYVTKPIGGPELKLKIEEVLKKEN